MNRNQIKITTVGQSNVGKTSLIIRMVNDKFETVQPTVGSCYNMMYINDICLSIWDTAGNERYRSLVPIYYRDSDIILMVYDVSDIQSFNELQKIYLEEIKKNNNTAILIYVGNKVDLLDNVFDKAAVEEKIDASYSVCTSAKSGEGIDNLKNIIGQLADVIIEEKDLACNKAGYVRLSSMVLKDDEACPRDPRMRTSQDDVENNKCAC